MNHLKRCFAVLVVCLLAYQTSESFAQESTLDVGLRIQKSASFYFENGVSVLYSDKRFFTDSLFLGFHFVSSRFGSALNSNAINQDTILFSAAWYWRKTKSIRPFGQLNTGYFRADYEEAVFDVLPNSALIISPELGIGYESKIPLKIAVSVGYNLTSGNGESGARHPLSHFYADDGNLESNKPMTKLHYLFFLVLLLSACDSTPNISDEFVDGDIVFDASIAHPENYLQSIANPNPTEQDAAKPVFIAIHGYSASTFEWDEFRAFSSGRTDYFISQVLLGGHGMTYDDFKQASWKTWQGLIKAEYDRLLAAGYANINFVGSSTGGALLIELLASGYFDNKIAPRHVFLVDPIIIPSSKMLSIMPIVGPVLGYAVSDNTTAEDRYWYHFRPQETLRELLDVTVRVRKQLEDGITLPAGTTMKVYKSIKDPTADPVSAVLIYKGIKTSAGRTIDVEMVDSDLHVFTRLALRSGTDQGDVANQLRTFSDIVSRGLN